MIGIIVLLFFLAAAGGIYYLRTHQTKVREALGRFLGGFPGSTQVNVNWNRGRKTLAFRVRMDYPADAVIVHYREKFTKKGWTPYGGDLAAYTGKWMAGERRDPSSGALSCVHSFQETWVNEKKNRMALLTLAYAMPMPAAGCPQLPAHNDLMVTLVESPFNSG